MAKKTYLDYGIPKNFHLTKTTRNTLIDIAILQKYSDKIKDFAKQESELLSQVIAEIMPEPKVNAFVKAAEFWVQGRDLHTVNLFISSTQLTIYPYIIGGNASSYSTEINGWPMRSTWFRRLLESTQNPEEFGFTHEDFKDYLAKHSVTLDHPFRAFIMQRYAGFEILRILQDYHGISLSCSMHLSKELHDKLNAFETAWREQDTAIRTYWNLVSKILNNYKSALTLCEECPEAIPWIQATDELNQYGKRCTDIPVKDAMEELRKM